MFLSADLLYITVSFNSKSIESGTRMVAKCLPKATGRTLRRYDFPINQSLLEQSGHGLFTILRFTFSNAQRFIKPGDHQDESTSCP